MSWLTRLFSTKLDVHEQKCVDDIRDHGCHVMQISAEGDAPQFAYSVGFPVSVGQPEVIVFGLSLDLMHWMVNEVRRQCAEEQRILRDGDKVDNLIDGFDCSLRHVTDKLAIKAHFGWAIWYHRSQRRVALTEAYQIVWPGKLDGLFPWDAGCAEDVIALQPALYETRHAA